jgi:hypothetical protein
MTATVGAIAPMHAVNNDIETIGIAVLVTIFFIGISLV